MCSACHLLFLPNDMLLYGCDAQRSRDCGESAGRGRGRSRYVAQDSVMWCGVMRVFVRCNGCDVV